MKLLSFILSIISFSFVIADTLANSKMVTFSSAVEISPKDNITLYDIAETRLIDGETLESFKNIEIAKADTQVITKQELAKKIRDLPKTLSIRFVFPEEIKLIRSKQNVSRMELERKIKNNLLSKCFDCEFQIQINSVPQFISSKWNIDLNIDLGKNSVLIPIESADSDKKGWVSANVKRYANAVVLNRNIKSDEVITEDLITIEKRYINSAQYSPSEIILDSKKLIGMQAAKSLVSGQVLTNKDLKRVSAVKKGQMVKAIVGNDTFEVFILAQTQEAGAIGDMIKIKNLESQKFLTAKVINSETVKID